MELLTRRLDPDLLSRIEALKGALRGRATDDFGFDPEAIKTVIPVVEWLYRKYFRVEAHGLEGLPPGRVLFVSNHSGQIPIDGMMIGAALLLDADPPRAVRSMVERWVPSLPYVGQIFSRLGQVLGTPENCRRLLDQDHAILVFPEGVRGINKTWDVKYQLQEFGHGFMRLALGTNTPIVPVGVVGAEEQFPTFYNARGLARLLKLPAVPVSASPVPLPVKYRIYFGEALRFTGDPHEDEPTVAGKVEQVKQAIDGLLQRGLAERKSLFR